MYYAGLSLYLIFLLLLTLFVTSQPAPYNINEVQIMNISYEELVEDKAACLLLVSLQLKLIFLLLSIEKSKKKFVQHIIAQSKGSFLNKTDFQDQRKSNLSFTFVPPLIIILAAGQLLKEVFCNCLKYSFVKQLFVSVLFYLKCSTKNNQLLNNIIQKKIRFATLVFKIKRIFTS